MKTIGWFTTFANFDPAYSLCNVVRSQLVALKDYKRVLFVLTNFKDFDLVPEGVEVRAVIPQLILEPYAAGDLTNLDKDTETATEAIEKNFKDIDVGLTHDIVFINSYLPYNIGLKKAIEKSLGHVKWLHWMHSAPSLRLLRNNPYDELFKLPPNSRLVYMNHVDVIRAAEMYDVDHGIVDVIYNPVDFADFFSFHPLTQELVDKYDLYSPEYLCVYPLSTTRMDVGGKQLSKVIQILGKLSRKGKSVKLVVPNGHANANNEKNEIQRMLNLGDEWGLSRQDIVFTSLHDIPKWEHGVPHKVVTDLFNLGNLYIFPSVSENCPLTLLEAMAAKNVLILNYSFPAMREFGGSNVLYFRFGSLVDDPQYPLGWEKYADDVATIIINEFEKNTAVTAFTNLRRTFNVKAVAQNQLIPAIERITGV